MNENKNIDRLFQEKFKDFEVFPEPHIWRNIEKQITKKKKRRIIPLWLRFGGAAAIVLFLISSGFWFFNTESFNNGVPNEIIKINSEKNSINRNSNNSEGKNEKEPTSNPIQKDKENSSNSELTKNSENTIINKSESEESFVKRDEKKINDEVKEGENALFVTSRLVQEFKVENDQKALSEIALEEIFDKQKSVLNDVVAEIEINEDKVNEVIEDSKWSIGSTMAPVYYNTLRNGSPIDPELANNNKSSNANLSYGFKVTYKISSN